MKKIIFLILIMGFGFFFVPTYSKAYEKEFDNKEDLETEKEELEKQKYTDINVETVKEEKEDDLEKQTYDTSKEAEDALNKYKEDHKEVQTEGVQKMPDASEDQKEEVKGETPYSTIEEAEDEKTRLENKSTEDVEVKATVRAETKSKEAETDILEKDENAKPEYSNERKNRANIFLRLDNNIQYEDGTTNYLNDYYVYIGDAQVIEDTETNANNSKLEDDSIDQKVKVNNDIIHNILSPMSMQEMLDFLTNKYNINTTNKTILFYVLKHQDDNKSETRSYTLDNKTISVSIDKCFYHIDAVLVDLDVFTSYYVDYTKTTKGYDYKVSATGKTIPLYILRAKEPVKENTNKDEKENTNKNEINNIKSNDKKIKLSQKTNAPKTGINDNYLSMFFLIISLMFVRNTLKRKSF